MKPFFRKISGIALCLVLGLLCACAERTYVLITVEVDPSVTEPITELRFDSLVSNGAEIFNEDSQRFDEGGKAIKLPRSFVVLANGWGSGGESVGVAVEAYGADGEVVARARGKAIILKGEESSEQVLLRPPCNQVTECLGGQAFCDNPFTCNCEGPECLAGFCDPVVRDDGNDCTEFQCDETLQSAANVPVNEGGACGTAASGAPLFCGQGICKEPACGDFIIDAVTGEECDEGQENSDSQPGACRTTCKLPSCGDGVIDNVPAFGTVYTEECDDGAANVVVEDGVENETSFGSACRQSVTLEDGSGVTLSCALPRCGDGVIDGNERCDDHDSVNGDGCNPTCSLRGEVSVIAGEPGGRGDADGIGLNSRLRLELPAGTAVIGDTVYFTPNDEVTPPDVLRTIEVSSASVSTVAGQVGLDGNADGVGSDALFSEPRGLAAFGSEVFVADLRNHLLRVYDTSTREVQTIAGTGVIGSADGPVSSATLAEPKFVAARSANDIIFMDTRASIGCRLRRLDRGSGTVTTLAGGNSCALPIGANFGRVGGMVAADDGAVYIADTNLIRKVEFDPLVITDIAGVFGPEGFVDGDGGVARFNSPNGLAVDGTTLYVADTDNNAIRAIDISVDPVQVSTLSFDTALDSPTTVAISGTTILIAEANSASFLAGTLGAGEIALEPFVGRNSNAGFANNSDARLARFDAPTSVGLVAGEPDVLYVGDLNNGALRILNRESDTGSVSTFPIDLSFANSIRLSSGGSRLFMMVAEAARSILRGMRTSGTPGVDSTEVFNVAFMEGITEFDGYVYAAEPTNSLIKRMEIATGNVEVFGGVEGANNIVDGPIATARFRTPFALVSCAGKLYVAESASILEAHVIREIDFASSSPQVTTIAGFATAAGHVDAIGLESRLDRPESLACDERDPDNPILYVAEAGSHTIRQIELSSGRVSTLAGVPFVGVTADGIGSEAGFNNPQGLVFEPESGDLFLVDQEENVVRRIE